MPGRLHHLDAHVTKVDDAVVADRLECIFGNRRASEANRRADAVSQLEMARDEIGMEVREEDVRDAKMVIRSERQVLIDVALRIDDGGQAARLVGNDVRGVSQAVQIELSQDHQLAGRSVTKAAVAARF